MCGHTKISHDLGSSTCKSKSLPVASYSDPRPHWQQTKQHVGVSRTHTMPLLVGCLSLPAHAHAPSVAQSRLAAQDERHYAAAFGKCARSHQLALRPPDILVPICLALTTPLPRSRHALGLCGAAPSELWGAPASALNDSYGSGHARHDSSAVPCSSGMIYQRWVFDFSY